MNKVLSGLSTQQRLDVKVIRYRVGDKVVPLRKDVEIEQMAIESRRRER